MTQRDPDPASLPEATPVLSYERQTDDVSMAWVVRFIGAWVICNAAAAASPQIVGLWRNGLLSIVDLRYWHQAYLPVSLFCNLALIGFGIAIARQRRYGFSGGLAMVVVALMPELVFRFSTGGIRDTLLFLLHAILPAAALFAVLLSVLRRADAKGVFQPIRANRSDTLEHGDSINFLVSRVGWIYLAWGGRVVLDAAMLPLLIWARMASPEWSWQTGISIALYLAVAICGLLLQQRKGWALGILPWLLLVNVVIQFASQWSYSSARANQNIWLLFYVYLPTVLETAVSIVMLFLLARKASRSAILVG